MNRRCLTSSTTALPLVLAALYDPSTGLVIWLLDGAPKVKHGKTTLSVIASDYQESKNVDQAGGNILPNTAFRRLRLRGVNGPTVTWLLPGTGACVGKATPLVVAGGSPRGVRSVRFFAGKLAPTVRMFGIDAMLVIGAKLSMV